MVGVKVILDRALSIDASRTFLFSNCRMISSIVSGDGLSSIANAERCSNSEAEVSRSGS